MYCQGGGLIKKRTHRTFACLPGLHQTKLLGSTFGKDNLKYFLKIRDFFEKSGENRGMKSTTTKWILSPGDIRCGSNVKSCCRWSKCGQKITHYTSADHSDNQ